MNVFDYIKEKDNIILSKLNIYDLNDLISLINKSFLIYRSILSVKTKTSFGIEIEFIDNNHYLADNYSNWEYKPENSINSPDGSEVSSPIFHNDYLAWLNIRNMCQLIKENCQYSSDSGGHIHIGTSTFQGQFVYWYNFIFLYAAYEDILYRFGYGEYLNNRPHIMSYASPICKELIPILLREGDDMSKKRFKFSKSRFGYLNEYYARHGGINFTNVRDTSRIHYKNTIEFRFFNGTFEETIWQNNINLLLNMIMYAKSDSFDYDLIGRHLLRSFDLKEYSRSFDLKDYNKIYFDKAIEFSDLIFNNNLDKVYFLRQYLKNNDLSFSSKLDKAKKFIK